MGRRLLARIAGSVIRVIVSLDPVKQRSEKKFDVFIVHGRDNHCEETGWTRTHICLADAVPVPGSALLFAADLAQALLPPAQVATRRDVLDSSRLYTAAPA
jgi:hypothetical protein